MKLLKGLPGFFIFLSVLYAAHHFVVFTFSGPTILLAAIVSYVIGLIVMAYPKKVGILLLVIAIFVSGILIIDYGVGRYQNSQSDTMTLDEEVSFWVQSATEETSHFALAQWVKGKLVRTIGVEFSQWLIYDRIQGQLLYGETVKMNSYGDEKLKSFEVAFLMLTSLLIFALIQLLLSKWVGPIGLYVPMFFYIALWFQYIDLSWGIYGSYIYGVMVYGIMRHFDKVRVTFKEEDQNLYPAYKIWRFAILGSVLLLTVTSAIFFLIPFKAINVTFDSLLPNIWGARSEYDTKQFRLYSLGETGFQGDTGFLGGPVTQIDTETPLFWVSLTKPIEKSLYLKSQVKTIYNGNAWVKREQTYKSRFDNYNSIPENKQLLAGENPDYIKGAVVFDQMKTISIFSPIGFYASSLDRDKVYVSEENQAFYKGGIFVRFLKEYAFEATQRDFTHPVPQDLEVSETLATEVVSISRTIGSYGASAQEKIAIIQEFLAENYVYDLIVPTKRVNPDFVSNFLLETKSGYCTYFASALAQMARINGIPARYVEGFRVDPSEVDPENLKAKVTEKDAHAWVEVYYEDLGWQVVEATPPYMAAANPNESEAAKSQLAAALAQIEAAKKAQALKEKEAGSADFDALKIQNEGLYGRGENDISADFMPENQGVRTKAKQTVDLQLTLIFSLLVLSVALFWWWPVITRFKRVHHGKVVSLIYGFSALVARTRVQGAMPLESQLALVKLGTTEKDLWVRILYDRKERITARDIEMATEQLQTAYAKEFAFYKNHRGFFKYWQMRLKHRV